MSMPVWSTGFKKGRHGALRWRFSSCVSLLTSDVFEFEYDFAGPVDKLAHVQIEFVQEKTSVQQRMDERTPQKQICNHDMTK